MAGIVRSATEPELEPVPRTRGAEKAELVGSADGAPNFAMRRFVLAPEGRIPKHSHPEIEHEQYVVRGELTIGIADETRVVGRGDVVFIPAETPHWYENRGDTPAEFLCTVPITGAYETDWLEEPPDGAYPE